VDRSRPVYCGRFSADCSTFRFSNVFLSVSCDFVLLVLLLSKPFTGNMEYRGEDYQRRYGNLQRQSEPYHSQYNDSSELLYSSGLHEAYTADIGDHQRYDDPPDGHADMQDVYGSPVSPVEQTYLSLVPEGEYYQDSLEPPLHASGGSSKFDARGRPLRHARTVSSTSQIGGPNLDCL
jgi:hypothetical protein